MKKIFILLFITSLGFAQGGYTPYNRLRLVLEPVVLNTSNQVLVRDAVTGNVGYFDKSTLGTVTSVTGLSPITVATGTTTPVIGINDASSTLSGAINNTSLQELGGVDKLINGVRVGKGVGSLSENVVFGIESLNTNTSGNSNTVVGWRNLYVNTTGGFNSAFGNAALRDNTTGFSNVAIGASALRANTTGTNNVAIGTSALRDNTTASFNTATGDGALQVNITGTQNTAYGAGALFKNTTGSFNLAFGASALDGILTTSGNTAVGASSGRYAQGSNNTYLGYLSGPNNAATPTGNSGSGNLNIGFQVGRNITTGSGNALIEPVANTSGTITTGINNLIIRQGNGSSPAVSTGITTGNANTIVGRVTGLSAADSNLVILSDGDGNITLRKNTDGTILIPNQTIALINADATGKTIVTKEYLNAQTNYSAKTADYTLLNTDYTVNLTANNATFTLPTAVGISGKTFVVKNSGSGTTLTIATTSGQTIDGVTTKTYNTQYSGAVLQSTGTNYIVIGNF